MIIQVITAIIATPTIQAITAIIPMPAIIPILAIPVIATTIVTIAIIIMHITTTIIITIIIILSVGNLRLRIQFVTFNFQFPDEVSLCPLLARILFGRMVFERSNFKSL
jgi:hypothetical protein